MFDALWIATTGMKAQEFRTQTIANNISNAATNGFKKDLAHFNDLAYQVIRGVGVENELGDAKMTALYIGGGVEVDSTSKVFTQGDVQLTDEPLDIAIQGNGFFGVVRPDPAGTGYMAVDDVSTSANIHFSRDGHFRLKSVNGDGNSPYYAVNNSDWALSDATGTPIQLDPNTNNPNGSGVVGTISVSNSGIIEEANPSITATANAPYNGSPYPLTADGVYIGNFIIASPNGLIPIGNSLFQNNPNATGGVIAGQPDTGGHGYLRGGYIEGSNVETIDEMVNLIEAQRGYELSSKVIEKADQMMSTLIQRT